MPRLQYDLDKIEEKAAALRAKGVVGDQLLHQVTEFNRGLTSRHAGIEGWLMLLNILLKHLLNPKLWEKLE